MTDMAAFVCDYCKGDVEARYWYLNDHLPVIVWDCPGCGAENWGEFDEPDPDWSDCD